MLWEKKPLYSRTLFCQQSRVRRSIHELCPFLSDKCFCFGKLVLSCLCFFYFLWLSLKSVKAGNLMGVYVLFPIVSNNRETSRGWMKCVAESKRVKNIWPPHPNVNTNYCYIHYGFYSIFSESLKCFLFFNQEVDYIVLVWIALIAFAFKWGCIFILLVLFTFFFFVFTRLWRNAATV